MSKLYNVMVMSLSSLYNSIFFNINNKKIDR